MPRSQQPCPGAFPNVFPDAAGEFERCRRIFRIFVFAHLVLWTTLPILLYASPPLDVVEIRYLGQEWQLGHHKHPPLTGWIGESAAILCGGSGWGIYLLAQVGLLAVFWAVWRLGREMLSPPAALVGACLLECCFYYTFNTVEFNNNIALYPFWSLTILFFYRAVTRPGNWPWIAAGLALGLGLLVKYSAALLAISMLSFLVFHYQARRAWRRPGPYLMALTAALVFIPHFVWLVGNRFPTLDYISKRSADGPALYGHLLCPLEFTCGQLLNLLPMALAALPLTGFPWRRRHSRPEESFKLSYLSTVVLGPFATYFAMAAILNRKLNIEWGSHIWMFSGLLLLLCFARKTGWRSIHAALALCVTFGVGFASGMFFHFIATPHVMGYPLRMHYPQEAIARVANRAWHKFQKGPLPMVAGDWWLASLAALEGSQRPLIYGGSDLNALDMGHQETDRFSDDDLFASGGVLLWDAQVHGPRPAELSHRYPAALFLKPVRLPYQTEAAVAPLELGLAIVPAGSLRGPVR